MVSLILLIVLFIIHYNVLINLLKMLLVSLAPIILRLWRWAISILFLMLLLDQIICFEFTRRYIQSLIMIINLLLFHFLICIYSSSLLHSLRRFLPSIISFLIWLWRLNLLFIILLLCIDLLITSHIFKSIICRCPWVNSIH